MSRERVVKSINWDEAIQTITMTYADEGVAKFNIGALPDDIKISLMLHGAQQRLSDVFAGRLEKKWTIADCRDASQKLYSAMASGEWGTRSGSGEGPSSILVIEALAQMTSKTYEEVAAKWKTLDDATKKGIQANPKVRETIAAIRLAKAQKAAANQPAVDVNQLFG